MPITILNNEPLRKQHPRKPFKINPPILAILPNNILTLLHAEARLIRISYVLIGQVTLLTTKGEEYLSYTCGGLTRQLYFFLSCLLSHGQLVGLVNVLVVNVPGFDLFHKFTLYCGVNGSDELLE